MPSREPGAFAPALDPPPWAPPPARAGPAAPALPALLSVFASRKMAALLFLGFASGMPYLLIRDALQAWMRKEGMNLSAIVDLSLLSMPFWLKVLWAPLLDRWTPGFLGRRRGWILLFGGALALAILWLAAQSPAAGLGRLWQAVLLVAFLSATLDVVTDAYRTDVLDEKETGAGAASFVLGYRMAFLLTGWLAFNLADRMEWPEVYRIMAAILTVGVFAAVWAPESLRLARPPETLRASVALPFVDFVRRLGGRHFLFALLFVLVFKLGDYLAASLTIPFLQDLGFTQSLIGDIRGGIGLLATILGTLAGGAVIAAIGMRRSLWILGGLQAASNLFFYFLALAGPDRGMLIATVLVENFCAGLGTAAFLGFLMSLCSPSFSATQFALLTCLMALGRDILPPSSGPGPSRRTSVIPPSSSSRSAPPSPASSSSLSSPPGGPRRSLHDPG